ncbi:MAG: ABC transporter permease [Rickettsiales bacterium]|nr:ABC transporter permease [Rickettsiales bacterium]
MNPSRIGAVLLRQFYLLRGSFTRVVPIFFWVAIDVVLWGFITKYLASVGDGFTLSSVMLGAVVFWGFLVRVIHGVSMAFFEDVWSRNFLNMFASPITTGEYVSGLVISSIITSAMGLAFMLGVATGFFGLSFWQYGWVLYPALLTLFLFGIALGIVGAAIVLRYGPAAEWFVWPIPAVISPFACVFYPLAMLPEWMQWVAHGVPASYIFEALRAQWLQQATPDGSMIWAIGLALIYIGLASWIFTRVYRHALTSGLIARYSAENVN